MNNRKSEVCSLPPHPRRTWVFRKHEKVSSVILDPGLRDHAGFSRQNRNRLGSPCRPSSIKIKMAGRKGRKRPKSAPKRPKKKILSENVNETIALNFEEKKPKLDDELEKRDEQSPGKQEPNFETAIDSTTIDSVEEVTGDWQAEESKYVPPFSRRAKRALKRNGAPLSPVARPKRSWRGVQQNLNDAQPLVLCPVDSDEVEKSSDVVRNEGRPATLKVCLL